MVGIDMKKIFSVIKESYFYLFDRLFNKKIREVITWFSCLVLVGDRGSGKSCLMSLICRVYHKLGYRVFCNFPYKNAYQIPYKTISTKYGEKVLLDKEFLYKYDLSHSLIMIDEARTVWNSRSYASWNELDEEFFNYIRKNDCVVVLATQRYDGIDLNIRVAADCTIFIQKCHLFKSFSSVDISRQSQLKVADTQTRVVSRGFSSSAQKVDWNIGEVSLKYLHFYRPFYYGDFDTNFVNSVKKPAPLHSWNEELFIDSDLSDELLLSESLPAGNQQNEALPSFSNLSDGIN